MQYIFDDSLVFEIRPPQTKFMATPMTGRCCLYPVSYS